MPREETGLAWLLRKQRIDRWQAKAGRIYGIWWSAEQEEGTVPIVSGIAAAGMPRGAGFGGDVMVLGAMATDAAVWKVDCARKLNAARKVLGNDLTLVADVFCGIGKRPREITQDQREAEQIAGDVFIVTRRLAEYLDDTDPGWKRREV